MSIPGHFARSRRLKSDSAKTDENPARGTTYRNVDGFPAPARESLIGAFTSGRMRGRRCDRYGRWRSSRPISFRRLKKLSSPTSRRFRPRQSKTALLQSVSSRRCRIPRGPRCSNRCENSFGPIIPFGNESKLNSRIAQTSIGAGRPSKEPGPVSRRRSTRGCVSRPGFRSRTTSLRRGKRVGPPK